MNCKVLLVLPFVLLLFFGCSGPEVKVSGNAQVYGEVDSPGYVMEYSPEGTENYTYDGPWSAEGIIMNYSKDDEGPDSLGIWNTSILRDGRNALRLVSGGRSEDLFHVLVDHVYISSPMDGEIIDTEYPLYVYGNAEGSGFQRYDVEIRYHKDTEWSSQRVELPDDGEMPVKNDLLATVNTSSFDRVGLYMLRLVVRYSDGTNTTESVSVYALFPDIYEPDDTLDNASAIEVSGNTQVRTIYPEGDDDYIKIPVKKGYLYRLKVRYDAYMYMNHYLYDQDRELADYLSMLSAEGAFETLTLQWESDGEGYYFLNLFSYFYDLGSYEINVTELQDSDDDGSPDDVDCRPMDPTVLAPIDGMQISSSCTLCPGDYALGSEIKVGGDDVHVRCNETVLQSAGMGYYNLAFDITGGSNISITGCTVEDFDSAIETNNYWSAVPVYSLRLEDNILDNNIEGIVVYYTYDSEITGNMIRSSSYGIGSYGSTGLDVTDNVLDGISQSALVSVYNEDLNLTNNTILCDGQFTNGIESQEKDTMIAHGNSITGCRNGISLNLDSSCRIYDNVLTDNTVGLAMRYCYSNEIVNNTVTGSEDSLGLISSSYNTISRNQFTGNGDGIALTDSRLNTMEDNTIKGNQNGMVFSKNSAPNDVVANTMHTNQYNIKMNQPEDIRVLDTDWGTDDIQERIWDKNDLPALGEVILKRDCVNVLPEKITGSIVLCEGGYSVEELEFMASGINLRCLGSRIEGDQLLVDDKESVQIIGCGLDGMDVTVKDSSSVELSGCTFEDSRVRMDYVSGSSVNENIFIGTSLELRKSPDNVVRANSFMNSTVGVLLREALWSQVLSNQFSACDSGIVIESTERFSVQGNTFVGGSASIALTNGSVADTARSMSMNVFRQDGLAIGNLQPISAYAPMNDFGVDTKQAAEELIWDEFDDPGLGRVNFTSVSLSKMKLCTDTDGGFDYYVKGYLTLGNESYEDHCDGGNLVEVGCDGTEMKTETVDCECLDGACVMSSPECTDSDGDDIYVKGVVEYGNQTYTDYCSSDVVVEYICSGEEISYFNHTCESGCTNGACIMSSKPECTDSDGLDFFVRGTVDMGTQEFTDYCSGSMVVEYTCEDNEVSKVNHSCENGCSDGACMEGSGDSCTDTDGGVEYFQQGSVTSDGEVLEDECRGETVLEYYCGDGLVHLKEFLCPNGCSDGRCEDPLSAIDGIVKISDQQIVLDNYDYFGSSVASYDIDSDGVNDLLVGASYDDGTGAVWEVYLDSEGNVRGKDKVQASLSKGDFFGADADITDIDMDGEEEYIVGAHGDDTDGRNIGAVWIMEGDQKTRITDSDFGGSLAIDDSFGSAVAGIGDLDRDGVPDLAVGAPQADDGGFNRGVLWILFMEADMAVKSYYKISELTVLDDELDNSDFFGSSVSAIGDLDSDGVQDLAVGAYGDDDNGRESGAVYVLFMRSDGTVKRYEKIGSIADEDSFFGRSVCSAGQDRIAVGAFSADSIGPNRGEVWLLTLDSDGSPIGEEKVAIDLDDDDHFGVAVSLADSEILAVGAYGDDDGGNNRGAVYLIPTDEAEKAVLTKRDTVSSSERVSLWQPREAGSEIEAKPEKPVEEEYEGSVDDSDLSLAFLSLIVGLILAFFVGGIVHLERRQDGETGLSATEVQALAYVSSMLKKDYTQDQIRHAMHMQNWPKDRTEALMGQAMRKLKNR